VRIPFLAAAALLTLTAAAQNLPKLLPDVPYLPSPNAVVDAMLKLAGVAPADNVYDLGCGDGRIVIQAAKQYKAHGVGIDINPKRIQEAQANALQARVGPRVRFEQNDLFQADIHDATVVTLYLLPSVNLRLRPKLLKELKPGARIVSHSFDMGDWKPDKELPIEDTVLYLWTVPAK
jgi:SAM-dependent methyltransferase